MTASRNDGPYRCEARTPDGTRCRKPAIGIDYEKGEPLCADHLEAALDLLEAGNCMDCMACPPAGAPFNSEMMADEKDTRASVTTSAG